jgi:hypothetical protein
MEVLPPMQEGSPVQAIDFEIDRPLGLPGDRHEDAYSA